MRARSTRRPPPRQVAVGLVLGLGFGFGFGLGILTLPLPLTLTRQQRVAPRVQARSPRLHRDAAQDAR